MGWYVLMVIALLYWLGSADDKPNAPLNSPKPNSSIAYKTDPPPALSERDVSPQPPMGEGTSSPQSEPTLGASETFHTVSADRLNVRDGPAASFDQIGQLSRGTKVSVISRRDGWAEVEVGPFKGWVSDQYIRPLAGQLPPGTDEARAQSPETAYVDADRLNVRSGPGTKFTQVWTLKANEKVTIIARSGDWAKLTATRYQGWVHADYLTARPAPRKLVSAPAAARLSAAAVRQILIKRSIGLYSGNCPCPYNVMKNGRRCGGNSAYSRPGGASPLCFPGDVTDAMVASYLARQ